MMKPSISRVPSALRILTPVLAFATAGAAVAQDEVDFETQIWPFLKESCVECHRAPYEEDGRLRKPKAGLRLDGAWAFMAGSEDGAVLVPGNAAESELWIRTDLPEDDDDFMPPTGKAEPLTDEQKALFARWINEGAEFGSWVGNLEGKPADTSNSGEEVPESELQTLYTSLADGLEPLEEGGWADVTAAGGRVMALADSSPLLSVDFRLVGEEADDADVATAASVGGHVAHLDLSRTAVSDSGLAPVADMPKLVRLDLHRTAVGDSALAHLSGLENLRYLNLYGTEISDAGLKHLHDLGSLRSVYVWQTKVTDKGVAQLQKALPDAKIVFK